MPEPEKTLLTYRVPYADTDQMGVVYYANYFVYFERLRNELIRASGTPYSEVEASGLMFPVIEAHCEYHSSARYDDLLLIRGWLGDIEGGRFRIDYEITALRGEVVASLMNDSLSAETAIHQQVDHVANLQDNTKGPLVTGHTTHVTVSLEGRPRRVPDYMKKLLQKKL